MLDGQLEPRALLIGSALHADQKSQGQVAADQAQEGTAERHETALFTAVAAGRQHEDPG